jgi:hypothetical protein
VQATKRKLEQIKGFSEAKVDKIKEALKKCTVSLCNVPAQLQSLSAEGTVLHIVQPQAQNSFVTAHELSIIRQRVIKIATGSKQLDAMVGGCVSLPLMDTG